MKGWVGFVSTHHGSPVFSILTKGKGEDDIFTIDSRHRPKQNNIKVWGKITSQRVEGAAFLMQTERGKKNCGFIQA